MDWTFAGLAFALWLMNLPLFLGMVRTFHDTKFVFDIFYFAYNDFFFNGALPRWLPFGAYGTQIDFLLIMALSPSFLFAGFLGWILNIRNVLFLFNLSLFLDQLIFLYGTYLLSKQIFKHKTTVAFVCLSSALSSVLTIAIFANFRFYYMLPLIIYFLVKFFAEFRLRHLALAMALFDISLIGLPTYLSVVIALELLIIGIFLLVSTYKDWPKLLNQSKSDILTGVMFLLIFAAATAAHYYFAENSLRLTEHITAGRDAVTHKTDFSAFMTYGGRIDFGKFLGMVFPSSILLTLDITLYFGLIPFIFLFYRFVKADFMTATRLTLIAVAVGFVLSYFFPYGRLDFHFAGMEWLFPMLGLVFVVYVYKKSGDQILTAFTSVVVVLGLFSLGERTVVAEALYRHFPLMDYYRHIGFTVSNFKLFLPLLAGFGVEKFLNRLEAEDGSEHISADTVRQAKVGLSVIVAAGSAIYVYIAAALMPPSLHIGIAALYLLLTVSFLFVLFWSRKYFPLKEHFMIFLVACVCFEMFSYQALVSYKFHLRSGQMPSKAVVLVNNYSFQKERTDNPTTPRARLAAASKPDLRNTYMTAYGFWQWDPCAPALNTFLINSRVGELFRLKGGHIRVKQRRIIPPEDLNFLRSIGCNYPKLRLVSDVRFANTPLQAKHLIRDTRNIDDSPVLYGLPEEEHLEGESSAPIDAGPGVIKVTGFSANKLSLKAEVPGKGGSWLYYTDAWHPAWKAYVDGKPVPVAQANLAFKAVKLPGGASKVSFVFDDPLGKYCIYFFAAVGIVFMLVVMADVIRMIVFPAHRNPLE